MKGEREEEEERGDTCEVEHGEETTSARIGSLN